MCRLPKTFNASGLGPGDDRDQVVNVAMQTSNPSPTIANSRIVMCLSLHNFWGKLIHRFDYVQTEAASVASEVRLK